jgi:hypothetical protein
VQKNLRCTRKSAIGLDASFSIQSRIYNRLTRTPLESCTNDRGAKLDISKQVGKLEMKADRYHFERRQ